MKFNYFGQLSITRIKIVFGTIYNFDKHLIDCVGRLWTPSIIRTHNLQLSAVFILFIFLHLLVVCKF